MDLIGGAGLTALAVAVAATLVLVVSGAWATDLGPWYYGLKQPGWKPSDAWFGPVWTTIFTLTAWAGLRGWAGAGEGAPRAWLVGAFALNGVLNLLWSVLFFKLRRPDWALAEVVLLWLSIVLLIVVCAQHDRWAPWLLVPYLIWVGFAAILNLAVVRLNAPF
jgi:tryptophan-rich sensory protein